MVEEESASLPGESASMSILEQLRRLASRVAMAAGLAVAVAACDGGGGGGSGGGGRDVGDNDRNVVVALGDSITSGNPPGGLVTYPALLASATGKRVVNGGVGGNAAADAAGRASGLMSRHNPGYLIILLGSNDAIQGRSLSETVAALRGIVITAKARKTIPILSTVPHMYGGRSIYNGRVDEINAEIRALASQEKVRVVNVAGAVNSEQYFTPDGLHPDQTGQQRIAVAYANAL
jgi:acyl-CoA thioesterase I